MLSLSLIFATSGCKGKKTEVAPSKEISQGSEKSSNLSDKDSDASSIKPNHRPRITGVDIIPQIPKIGDILNVKVLAEDIDGDDLLFNYKWIKEGEVVSTEETLELNPDKFKRGDEIKLMIIPFDGKEEGDPGYVYILIGNAPPEITSSPNSGKIHNKIFTYYLNASDPDGDPLTYALKEAPPGMTIDNSGLIKWDIPPDFKGKARVTVSVTDGHGGEASQSFTLEITPQ
jgi:hypothetical protein